MTKITAGSEIELQYTLTYDNDNGELIEETTPEDPLLFKLGQGEMLDAFEEKLLGLTDGSEFSFTLEPEKAYGPFQEVLLAEYAKSIFLVDDEIDEDFLQEGELIEMKDEDGNFFEGMIEENKKNSIVVNFNHPLAGESIHFKGTITKVS